jgi:hypothetical protein
LLKTRLKTGCTGYRFLLKRQNTFLQIKILTKKNLKTKIKISFSNRGNNNEFNFESIIKLLKLKKKE